MLRFLGVTTIILGGLLACPDMSLAKSPVVVELFGRNSCDEDTIAQEDIQNVLKSESDIILINCRTVSNNKGVKAEKSYTRKFCNDRKNAYNKKYNGFAINPDSYIVVNGKWDANYNDVLPAIKVARSDNIGVIDLSIENKSLNISLPEIKSDVNKGDIILYTYAPTIDEKVVFVDPDVDVTDKLKTNIVNNINIPFVTKDRTTPFYLRPVLARDNLGRWNGNKMEFTIPLKDVAALTGSTISDLGYIVVLHEGDETGAIIAAGEEISMKEYYNTLPHSEPINLQLVSQPDK